MEILVRDARVVESTDRGARLAEDVGHIAQEPREIVDAPGLAGVRREDALGLGGLRSLIASIPEDAADPFAALREAAAAQEGLGGAVRFLGHRRDMPALLAAADHLHVMGSSLSSTEFVDLNIEAAEAVKRVFDKHGNRKNRNKARLRFLLEALEPP